MNAEEKYEQALTRARELYNAAKVYDFTDDMKMVERIFPELNEKSPSSADEVQYNRGYDAGYIIGRAFAKELLDKQEELTHSQVTQKNEQDECGKEDEDNLRDAIVIIDRYRMETQYADIKKTCERCIDWIKSIKERIQGK